MDLQIDGTVRKTVIVKGDIEVHHKVIEVEEENKDNNKWAILTTHINDDKKEVLDFFAYLTKEKIDNLIANMSQEAKEQNWEIVSEEKNDGEPTVKHYIFTDESHSITYEDDYATIEEAQAFCDLLVKQFGKNFTYSEG